METVASRMEQGWAANEDAAPSEQCTCSVAELPWTCKNREATCILGMQIRQTCTGCVLSVNRPAMSGTVWATTPSAQQQ